MQTISDRINQRMNELGISQADIKRATGAGKATISSWVKGDTNPSGSYASKLASCLKCTSDWLLTGEGNPTPTAPATTEANLPSLLESSSNSVIDLMDNLRGLEKQGELTPELVSLLNATIDTFKKVKPQT